MPDLRAAARHRPYAREAAAARAPGSRRRSRRRSGHGGSRSDPARSSAAAGSARPARAMVRTGPSARTRTTAVSRSRSNARPMTAPARAMLAGPAPSAARSWRRSRRSTVLGDPRPGASPRWRAHRRAPAQPAAPRHGAGSRPSGRGSRQRSRDATGSRPAPMRRRRHQAPSPRLSAAPDGSPPPPGARPAAPATRASGPGETARRCGRSPTTSSGTSETRRARASRTSRVRSSAQWRSSRATMVRPAELASGQDLGDVEDEEPSLLAGVAGAVRRRRPGALPAGLPSLLETRRCGPCTRAQVDEDRGPGDPQVARIGTRPNDTKASRRRPAARSAPSRRRLADAGFAREQEEPARCPSRPRRSGGRRGRGDRRGRRGSGRRAAPW